MQDHLRGGREEMSASGPGGKHKPQVHEHGLNSGRTESRVEKPC